MKLLLFINQKNYYEEILIQIILTLEAFGIAYYIDSLYSIIINGAFIFIFVVLLTCKLNVTLFRIWYHHQFYVALPIFVQNQNFDALSSINVLLMIVMMIFFLSYTEILGDIQTHKMLRIFKYTIVIIAFTLNGLEGDAQIITIIVYDGIVLMHTFLLSVVAYQDILRLQISVLISFNRFLVLILLYFVDGWKIMYYLPILIYITRCLLLAFLHQEIRIALRDSHFRLKQIVMIQFTYQLGQYPGLFYLSQVLVMHSKDCDRPDCFCTKRFQLTQEQTWKSSAEVLKQSLNQILCEILRLYNWSQLRSCGEECLLLLCRIETEYRNDKLFETLLRSRYLVKDRYNILRFFPHNLRIEGHRQMFYNKLLGRIQGVRLNSHIYFTYCELVEQLGQIIVKLLHLRQYILIMLTVQYQYPLYYLFDNKLSYYVQQYKKCEILMNDVLKLNPHSTVSQHLLYAVYSMVTFQFEKLKSKQTKYNLSNHLIDPLWDILNDRQCCFVQCKYDKGLILINHSILFTQLMEETEIKSEFLGQYIDKLIANPVRDIHDTFLKRLINDGQPKLLNIGIQKFYIVTMKGFMKQIDSLVRLGSSMENLTFMTIMGYKLEDQCGQIFLSQEGHIHQYNEQAANFLKLDKQFQHHQKIHLNLKICIPLCSNKNELYNGLILIPKINLVSKEQLQKTITSRDMNQISFFKYFLKHPKQCNIFSAAYKFCDNNYDKLCFETLYIYSCNEVRDVETKMISLELMLKQIMLTNNIQNESYMTSYTTFKSIIPTIYNHKSSNSGKSPTHYEDIDDNNFVISNESIHIQQDPQSFPLYQFVPEENSKQQEQQEIDQQNDQKSQNHQVNYSSMIANSFQTQDLLFSSRRINEDLSARESKNENQGLLQQNLNINPDSWIHQQKIVLIDAHEEPESPEEEQTPQKMEVSIKDMTEQYILEQIEWIKSQAKFQKQQINKQTKFQSSDVKKKKIHKITLDRQPSSIKSTDSQKGLINHIVNGMIKSGAHQFYGVIFIAIIYIVALIILIVLSIYSLEKESNLLYLDTIGGQFSITLLQDYNLMLIAINVLSTQPSFQAVKFYIGNSTDDYIQYSENVNNKQNINYQFLKNLDTQQLKINHSFSNFGQYEVRFFYTRKYLVDSLRVVYHGIEEKVERNSSFNVTHMEESYFTFNYVTIFQLAISLIEETDQEINFVQDEAMNIALIYVIVGFCTCFVISLSMGIAEIQIMRWRVTIIRTYFLFQNLQQSIVSQEQEIRKLLEVDELKHIKYSIIKQDKATLVSFKQDQKNQDQRLKKKFLAKHLISLLLFSTLELLYFIPYYSFFQNSVSQHINFHEQIYTLGLAQLAFSNRLTHFIQLYSNSQNNIDETLFQKNDIEFSVYEDDFLFTSPYDELEDQTVPSYIVNHNVCNLNSVKEMEELGYQCPFILQDGLSKFVISTTNLLYVLGQEYNKAKGLEQILNDNEFANVIIGYGYVFPQFAYYRDLIFREQEQSNNNQYVQAILMAVLILLAILSIFFLTICFISRSFYQVIITAKRALLIFSKEQIAKNKHLVQVLSREVTFD